MANLVPAVCTTRELKNGLGDVGLNSVNGINFGIEGIPSAGGTGAEVEVEFCTHDDVGVSVPFEEALDIFPGLDRKGLAVLVLEYDVGLGGPEFNRRRAAEAAASRGVEAL